MIQLILDKELNVKGIKGCCKAGDFKREIEDFKRGIVE